VGLEQVAEKYLEERSMVHHLMDCDAKRPADSLVKSGSQLPERKESGSPKS